MEIDIIPVAVKERQKSFVPSTFQGGNLVKETQSESTTFKTNSVQKLQSAQVVTTFVSNIEEIFAKFLKMEVGDGAASADTIRSYISQTKQYLDWCKENLFEPLGADAEDIKFYRQYLVQSGYQNSTIATKLNIVRIFYKAALTHGLIKSNPAEKIKAPKDRKDPAARITFMEAEELKFLLDHIQSQLERAKTNKQKLVLMRDRVLIGIMSLEGCRTVEMHQLKIEDIVRQRLKTGLQVSAKRASRIVPLTNNLTAQLDEYLEIRRKVLRRKIKPQDFVFVSLSNNSKGKQLSRRSIRSIIDGYLEATNLKHTSGRILSAHSLRHTAGTLALRTGSDLRQVQDLLSHADPRTTSIYAHVGDRWEHNPGDAVEQRLADSNS